MVLPSQVIFFRGGFSFLVILKTANPSPRETGQNQGCFPGAFGAVPTEARVGFSEA
jgi:hypothetical protein